MLHAPSRLWCFHFALRFSMLSPLVSRLGPFRLGLSLGFGGSRLGCRLRSVVELRGACLDRFIGRQLGLGVELKIAFCTVECVGHRVVAWLAIAPGVKELPEPAV